MGVFISLNIQEKVDGKILLEPSLPILQIFSKYKLKNNNYKLINNESIFFNKKFLKSLTSLKNIQDSIDKQSTKLFIIGAKKGMGKQIKKYYKNIPQKIIKNADHNFKNINHVKKSCELICQFIFSPNK